MNKSSHAQELRSRFIRALSFLLSLLLLAGCFVQLGSPVVSWAEEIQAEEGGDDDNGEPAVVIMDSESAEGEESEAQPTGSAEAEQASVVASEESAEEIETEETAEDETADAEESAEEESSEEPAQQEEEEGSAEFVGEETADEAEEEVAEEPEDTSAPVLKVYAAAAKVGSKITPEQFIKHYEDESEVHFYFAKTPSTKKVGEYSVTVVAEDASGNKTEKSTKLFVCDRLIELELEDRTYSGLRLREMVGTLHGYHPSIEYYKVKKEGATSFILYKGDKTINVGIQVRDTKRPKAKAVDSVCFLGYAYKPEYFVTSVSDEQEVTFKFMEDPDWNTPGERDVRIAVIDASDNRRIVKAKVTFKQDDVAPKLYVNVEAYHYVGDAVAYMKGVSAKDNLDPDCEITVDKSKVKYRRVGVYPVTYTATDRDGNSTSVTVDLHFIEPAVTDEQLDELAESILGEIIKDNMSVAEKIKAIYDYCRYKIRYTGSSDKTDWKGEAYRGLTEFKGDCFTYYAASYLLLNKIDGVEVLSVERIGGKTHHYWCLVNVGTGWYHYDTCPNHIFGTCFMRTNEQVHQWDGKAYWKYAESEYPDLATKSFKMF